MPALTVSYDADGPEGITHTSNCPKINSLLTNCAQLKRASAAELLRDVEAVVGRLTPARRKKLTTLVTQRVSYAVNHGWRLGVKAEEARQSFVRSGSRDGAAIQQTIDAVVVLLDQGTKITNALRAVAEQRQESFSAVRMRWNRYEELYRR